MQEEADDQESTDRIETAEVKREAVECLRCGRTSPAGEFPPLLGCPDGTAGFDPEHFWSVDGKQPVTDGGRRRDLRDGESRDGRGGVRPVPPGVDQHPGTDR